MNLIFIFGAQYLFVLSVVIAGIYWFRQPRSVKKEIAIYGFISVVFIYLVALLASHFFYNPRPFVVGNFSPLIPHAPDNGFPSDHTLLTSAIATVIYRFNKQIGLSLWIVAICVGISRVYVGVHHPIDVIGSAAIALVVSYLVYKIMQKSWDTSLFSKR